MTAAEWGEPLDPLVGQATKLIIRFESAVRGANPMLAALLPLLPRDAVDDLARGVVELIRAVAQRNTEDVAELFSEELSRVLEDS